MATPASQPIGNVIAAAPTREIKLPPFEEDMPQAWYNQAEAFFRLHGVTDRMFWFYYVQWALMPVPSKQVITSVGRNSVMCTCIFSRAVAGLLSIIANFF